MRQRVFFLLLSLTIIFGVAYTIFQDRPEVPRAAFANARNGTYVVEGKIISLTEGRAEQETAPGSATKIVTTYFGNEARADLNGDGREDIGFILVQTGGGSGTFFYAAAALGAAGGYRGTNAVLLGDRIAPQTTEARDGILTVHYADRAPGSSMTTPPSVGVSKHFLINQDRLVETRGREIP